MVESTAFSLERYSREARKRVDGALDAYTRFDEDCPQQLAEAMRYSLLAPGKRLRPLLVLLAAEACGGDETAVMPAACAVEMIHAYSLIHDDLPAMDDDDLRRGRPTCHKVYGEALAILAGDALLTLAFELLARETQPPAVAAECCTLLGRAAGCSALVGGQADDLAGQFSEGSAESLMAIHRRKTGAMMLVSLQLGATISGADAGQLAALTEYGQCLGLAFQITDDLLDVRGETAAMGKRVNKDSDRGKLTYPGLLGIEESERRAEALVDQAIRALKPLEPQAAGLQALALYVLHRNH